VQYKYITMEMLPEKGVCFSGKLTDNKKADREKGGKPCRLCPDW
jgi:hypothetical protein